MSEAAAGEARGNEGRKGGVKTQIVATNTEEQKDGRRKKLLQTNFARKVSDERQQVMQQNVDAKAECKVCKRKNRSSRPSSYLHNDSFSDFVFVL